MRSEILTGFSFLTILCRRAETQGGKYMNPSTSYKGRHFGPDAADYADAVDKRCHPIPEDGGYQPKHIRSTEGPVIPVESDDE